ncbi:hypothetical protein Salmuc_05493 [Salipiger mucosus DSM 16094]|uniref:Sulfotransferase family protein n=1 Tax=Salipiger mucosus DSM 16094 TaxID=1123237 RepID=S9QJ19_9RHOB|nr:hypothetical protein Salmuc_05493 [Salipiger mucosus DSM 16094]
MVVHAGFHKTGTSSVQTMLRGNRAALEPHLRILLKEDFEPLTEAARALSHRPSDEALAAVGRYAARLFRRVAKDDPRPLLLSSEDLSGLLPGRRGVTDYGAAPLVMAKLAENARYRFGAALDLAVCFSTRGAPDWLRSSWWQSLRSTRLTEDFDTYARRLAPAADMAAVVAEVQAALPDAQVTSVPLERSREMPQGPLTPLLDLAGLGQAVRDTLEVPGPVNAQPEARLAEVFLALNRSELDDARLSEAKTALRRIATRA